MATPRTPDFFLVGAPKSGTTALFDWLGQHPRIHAPVEKEPHHFGSDLDFRDHPRLSRETYLALFAGTRPDQLTGEASVFSLLSERAADEIAAFRPDAKIIALFRNPVDVIHSFHSQRRWNTTEDLEDLRDALAAEADRREGRRLPAHVGLVQGLQYRRVAAYGTQLQRFVDRFPRNQLLVLLHEDLQRDPAAVYATTCRFLGLEPDPGVALRKVNVNKTPRSRLLRGLLWKRPPLLDRAARLLVPRASWRKALRRMVDRLNMREAPREPLEAGLRRQLSAELKPEVEHLSRLIGRDLTHWSA